MVPLAIYHGFSPYKAPKLSYVVLAVLLVSQYANYKEKNFRKKIEEKITAVLKAELARVPARKEIYERSSLVIQFRGLTIAIASLIILAMMFYYQDF